MYVLNIHIFEDVQSNLKRKILKYENLIHK